MEQQEFRLGASVTSTRQNLIETMEVIMVKKHTVKFKAKKPVSVPVDINFKTDEGKKVSFPAHKTVKKKVTVKFRAKD